MRSQPFQGTNRDIEKVANELRALLQKDVDEPLETRELLKELVKRTKGEVVVVEDPSVQEANGGSLVIRGERDYTIFLSPYTTPLRDNFTIAHELGHYVLHFFPQKEVAELPMSFTRYGASPIEWQANRFAAALLMPEQRFREKFADVSGDLYLLAGYFGVSRPAVEVRAKSLNLMAECA
jgi:Zn-dependent peptidase ImmA (M78 family)